MFSRHFLSLALLGIVAFCAFPAGAAEAPSKLRVNLLEFPERTTIPSRTPRFSWVFHPNAPGETQSAYQIIVSSSASQAAAGNGDRWNSGVVDSAKSLDVAYGGAPLAAGTTSYWRVRTWSDGAGPTGWSAVQAFTIDGSLTEPPAFPPNTNDLVWIWYPESTYPSNASRYFRRKFTPAAGKTVAAAQLLITTDNSCDAYLNGTLVATSTNWKVFTVVNVTPQMANGANVLAVRAFNLSDAAGLTGKIQLRYSDGTEETVSVDTSTKASLTNPTDWTTVGFNDSSWAAAKSLGSYGAAPWNTIATFPSTADRGTIFNASSNAWSGRYKPAFDTQTPPVKVEKISSGRYFVDFGKDAFGYLTVRMNGSFSGQTMTVRMGESANGSSVNPSPGGTIRYKQTTVSLANGNQTYAVQPSSTTTGIDLSWSGGVMPFRYAELINCPATLTENDVRQVVLHTPFDVAAATFSSSNPTLNAVWELCQHSMKATTFAGVYIDGDRERKPYEADAYINQLSHYAVDAEFTIGRYSLEYLLRNSTWPTEWKFHFPLIAWADYLYTGNKEALAANYDLIVSHVDQYRNQERADGLLVRSTDNIVDWPAGERDGYEMTNVNTVVNAFYYKSWRLLAEIATALGKTTDAATFNARADRMQSAFDSAFWNSADGVYRDGETTPHESAHANFFPMALGLVPASRIPPVMAFLKTKRMAPSVYGAQYLLEALFEGGEEDYAIGLMADNDPSYQRHWWNMIAAGSTITMEAWDNGFKPNQDWNHAWGAAPGNIVSRYVLGLKPLTPGFGKAEIRPQLGTGNGTQGLTQASGTIPTIRGPVQIAAQNSPTSFQMTLTLPGNMTADVIIPTKGFTSPAAVVDGQIQPVVLKDGKLVIKDLPSGPHTVILTNVPPPTPTPTPTPVPPTPTPTPTPVPPTPTPTPTPVPPTPTPVPPTPTPPPPPTATVLPKIELEPDGLSLHWPSEPGMTYRIRRSPDLKHWESVNPLYLGTGGELEHLESFEVWPDSMFYSIALEP